MSDTCFLTNDMFEIGATGIPLYVIREADLQMFYEETPAYFKIWADSVGFSARAGEVCLVPPSSLEDIPNSVSAIEAVLVGMGNEDPKLDNIKFPAEFQLGSLPAKLPYGIYHLHDKYKLWNVRLASMAWALGSYRYRYTVERRENNDDTKAPLLFVDDAELFARLQTILKGVYLCRDMVNAPANHMNVSCLCQVVRDEVSKFDAACRLVKGNSLFEERYPLIHAVGRAGASEPALIDVRWGNDNDPHIVIIGKGVCFDTGGVCIKPPSAMLNMKKDMGGAATALALAIMLMKEGVRVHLRLLIPAVENSISSLSFLPGDVIESRSGKTVEVYDTDAEGRLILADALTAACEENPDLVVDFATLTGAARVALGGDITPFYTNSAKIADELIRASILEGDPLWQMPLWDNYSSALHSKVADVANVGKGGPNAPGSIVAALFLQMFMNRVNNWVHFDCFSWNSESSPSKPAGGECNAARAMFHVLERRYGKG